MDAGCEWREKRGGSGEVCGGDFEEGHAGLSGVSWVPSVGVLIGLFYNLVSVKILSRLVTVTGPRGVLKKDLKHLSVSFESSTVPNTINISLHHGGRKNVAALRTVKSLIANMVIGVTRGYKYKMRYVYAHFPINVNIDTDKETGLGQVEIRWVAHFDCPWKRGAIWGELL